MIISQVSYRTNGPLVSTFSLMCSIYRHVCSVFFLKYDIYKQPQEFVALEWSVLKTYMLKET